MNIPLPSPGTPVDWSVDSVVMSGSGNTAVMFSNGCPTEATLSKLVTYRPFRASFAELATLSLKVQCALVEVRRAKPREREKTFIANMCNVLRAVQDME